MKIINRRKLIKLSIDCYELNDLDKMDLILDFLSFNKIKMCDIINSINPLLDWMETSDKERYYLEILYEYIYPKCYKNEKEM